MWLVVQGSIEQAVAQVEAFRGLLEHRVIARFDAAVAAGDLGGMAECACIMAEFRQGESQLVQVTTKEVLLFSDQHCMQGGPASCLLYRPSNGQLTDAPHSSNKFVICLHLGMPFALPVGLTRDVTLCCQRVV